MAEGLQTEVVDYTCDMKIIWISVVLKWIENVFYVRLFFAAWY